MMGNQAMMRDRSWERLKGRRTGRLVHLHTEAKSERMRKRATKQGDLFNNRSCLWTHHVINQTKVSEDLWAHHNPLRASPPQLRRRIDNKAVTAGWSRWRRQNANSNTASQEIVNLLASQYMHACMYYFERASISVAWIDRGAVQMVTWFMQ